MFKCASKRELSANIVDKMLDEDLINLVDAASIESARAIAEGVIWNVLSDFLIIDGNVLSDK